MSFNDDSQSGGFGGNQDQQGQQDQGGFGGNQDQQGGFGGQDQGGQDQGGFNG